jgi:hypothetical protein
MCVFVLAFTLAPGVGIVNFRSPGGWELAVSFNKNYKSPGCCPGEGCMLTGRIDPCIKYCQAGTSDIADMIFLRSIVLDCHLEI